MSGEPEGDGAAGVDFVVGDEPDHQSAAGVRSDAATGPHSDAATGARSGGPADAGSYLDPDEELPREHRRSRRGWAVAAVGVLGACVVIRVAGSHGAPSTAAASQRAAASAASSGAPPSVAPQSAALSAAASSAPDVADPPPMDAAVTGPPGVGAPLGDAPSGPTASVVTVPAGSTAEVPVLIVPAPPPVRFDPRRGVLNCPDVYACTVDRSVPAGVTAAVRRSFAGAVLREVVTVYGRRDGGTTSVLLRRTIVAGAGRTYVTVDVRSRLPDDRAMGRVVLGGDYLASSYRDIVPLYTVTVQAREPKPAGGVPIGMHILAVLADDAGLMAR